MFSANLLQMREIDWPATVGMLTVISMVSAFIAALIGAIVVKPMIDKAKSELVEMVNILSTTMVSKELFGVYTKNDEREHAELKNQFATILERMDENNHRR